MANKIEAITTYRPRVDRDRTLDTGKLASYIEARTSLNHGEILNVLMELHEGIKFFCLEGNAVKISGLGTFGPSIQLNGRLRVNTRLDVGINKAMNVVGAFKGAVVNRDNIGKTSDDLVELWNAEHPDDPVE
jgi:hypothetical protein